MLLSVVVKRRDYVAWQMLRVDFFLRAPVDDFPPLYERMYPPRVESSRLSATGSMPKVGLPEANMMLAPFSCAVSNALRVAGVTSFLLLVSVPSRSSAMARYTILLFVDILVVLSAKLLQIRRNTKLACLFCNPVAHLTPYLCSVQKYK